MENTKFIDDFTSKFLSYGRLTLFLLFSFVSFDWYSTSDPTPANITTVLNLIGVIGSLAWFYAIGNKANEILTEENIVLAEFKFLKISLMSIIASLLIMYFFSTSYVDYKHKTNIVTYHVIYTKPLAVSFFCAISVLMTAYITAKTFVSAEKRKEASFSDYYKTLLMFSFPLIGLWFIQPRVKELY